MNLLDGTAEVAPIFRDWLALHYPQRAARIMARIHEMRGGQDYDSDFATRMKGSGLWVELIAQRFEKACQRLGGEVIKHDAQPQIPDSRFQDRGCVHEIASACFVLA